MISLNNIWTFWSLWASQVSESKAQWVVNFFGHKKSMTIFIGFLAWTFNRHSSKKRPDPDWVPKSTFAHKKSMTIYIGFLALTLNRDPMQKKRHGPDGFSKKGLWALKLLLVDEIFAHISTHDPCLALLMSQEAIIEIWIQMPDQRLKIHLFPNLRAFWFLDKTAWSTILLMGLY